MNNFTIPVSVRLIRSYGQWGFVIYAPQWLIKELKKDTVHIGNWGGVLSDNQDAQHSILIMFDSRSHEELVPQPNTETIDDVVEAE